MTNDCDIATFTNPLTDHVTTLHHISHAKSYTFFLLIKLVVHGRDRDILHLTAVPSHAYLYVVLETDACILLEECFQRWPNNREHTPHEYQPCLDEDSMDYEMLLPK